MTLQKKSYSVDIALTVTLFPKLFKDSPPLQYRQTHTHLEMLLKEHDCEYVIIPELTPKNGNVHYHCILRILVDDIVLRKGPLYVIRNMFRRTKYFGYIDVKQCEDVAGWIKYMTKELYQTVRILDLDGQYYLDTKIEQIKNYVK